MKLYQKGFTLIELLVVIAIIGVLAALVTASINDSRAKSRNASMVSQLKEFQKALELYYLDNNEYPAVSGATWGCLGDYSDGRCWNGNSQSESSGFVTTMASYIAVDRMPTPPPNTVLEGAIYRRANAAQGYEIRYALEGGNMDCPIGEFYNSPGGSYTQCFICENGTGGLC